MRKINKIIIHCTDTPASMEVTEKDILHWHTDPKPKGRGWDRMGYHFLIQLNGSVIRLESYDKIAYGCTGQNAHSIHICYVGRTGMNEKQDWALNCLIHIFKKKIVDLKIYGHNEFNKNKTCPGFDVQKWLKNTII